MENVNIVKIIIKQMHIVGSNNNVNSLCCWTVLSYMHYMANSNNKAKHIDRFVCITILIRVLQEACDFKDVFAFCDELCNWMKWPISTECLYAPHMLYLYMLKEKAFRGPERKGKSTRMAGKLSGATLARPLMMIKLRSGLSSVFCCESSEFHKNMADQICLHIDSQYICHRNNFASNVYYIVDVLFFFVSPSVTHRPRYLCGFNLDSKLVANNSRP